MSLGKFTKSVSRLSGLVVLAAALGMSGCGKEGGGSSKKGSERLKWVKSPTTGSQDGKNIKIPGLKVSFEQPEVLYVYKECSEAAHSDKTDEGWIPVITCTSTYGGGDELDEERTDVALTIFAGEKKTIINERGVAILKQQYVQEGYEVDEIIYIEDYQGKRGRRGIQSILQVMDADGRYPEREIQRFRFPVGDIVFVAQVDYPYGDDRSGIESDWQRILWNFQLDEDGPLYPDQDTGSEE